ncbi:prenyltransferase/squalene oxidase repeat-containing protein [Archangium primigenium]|uniref:prenyltransferase/squalene oxidase repeat-containing protein n=1 Tax=[Archangium] primigenium TaxID=2792470 RepID=UPI00195E0B0E|nr:prenyltransferase/squalene oxidase repeat-containing protein [Archangium primigenium]MBM7114657.1 hypothetical protein [Archangium primigenium]
MSPSVYDTAQVLRILGPRDNDTSVVEWLLEQQAEDGGWGDAAFPLHRDIPTLSAILALRGFREQAPVADAIQAGLAFLRTQAPLWADLVVDELPVAAEILLPSLLKELGEEGDLPREPYAKLMALGERKQKIIAKLPMRAGVPWIHVWETWGAEPLASLMDGAGSIGHSASATAAWIKAAEGRPELESFVQRGQDYLRQSMRSTGMEQSGLVPVGAPHTYFEQSFVLYGLLMAGLLDEPALAEPVRAVLGDLTRALGPHGIGMSDYFLQDGDDTSAVVAVMHALGLPADAALLRRFQKDDHFIAYPGEMNSSPTLTARCVHALRMLGETDGLEPFHQYLIARQEPSGRWSTDKWNRSWLYATFHSVIGLIGSEHTAPVLKALEAVLSAQSEEGGWSSVGEPNMTETSYAVLMLGYLERHGVHHAGITRALDRASQWMMRQYSPFTGREGKVKCWISKELYRMERIDSAFELSALLMLRRRG